MVIAVGWLGGRPLFRLAEKSFWSLNSLVVQPAYTVCREALRQLAERLLSARASKIQRVRLRAAAALVSGGMICGVALLVLVAVLPHADLLRGAAGVGSPEHLAVVALANTVALIAGYLAAAALVWAIADATMAQPRDLEQFDERPAGGRTWRIAHLSDMHVVGERYGFRLESGRSGPRGNERLSRLLAELETLHASDPLDAIVVSGDMTDAGRSSEWAEFLDAVLRHPRLAERMLIIPGNHDLNIVDRANPARLDLPTSPNRAATEATGPVGDGGCPGRTRPHGGSRPPMSGRNSRLHPGAHSRKWATFADTGRPWRAKGLVELWTSVFPMVLPPDSDDGLGDRSPRLERRHAFLVYECAGHDFARSSPWPGDRVARSIPHACWVVVLHHHVVEYPSPGKGAIPSVWEPL